MALADAVPFVVSAWNLDEASGTRADQVSTNDLTDNNTVTSQVGLFDTAAEFERDNSEFLHHNSNSELEVGDEDWCLSMWVNHESTLGIQGLAGKWDFVGGQHGWRSYYFEAGGGYTFDVRYAGNTATAGVVSSTGATSSGVWNLVVISHDSVNNNIRISVNGTESTTSHSGGIDASTARFTLGVEESFVGYADALIDDVVFMKGYILSPSEIDELYNSGAGVAFVDWAGVTPSSRHLLTGGNLSHFGLMSGGAL